ncbi:uncharacterized protein LTR77_005896 [Saxophila tyrrhenica]|uniref:Uncharacterized protein n=1 Tax=Saxophila tyrrhenica TaxID=1690608 RepID=A0AAV9PA72_9PEZI|nr:hypothetical protein LTR77_005896 [Saxophila tyrrhenica]
MLKYRGAVLSRSQEPLEQQLLATLRGPVAFAALWIDNTGFSDNDWYEFSRNYEGGAPERRIMQCMSRVPVFLKRGKMWKHDPVADPTLPADITACYETLRLTNMYVRETMQKTKQRFADGELDYLFFAKIDFALVRLDGLALAVTAIVGCMLLAVSPSYRNLQQEMDEYATDVLRLAHQLDRYRPLGACAMPLCLAVCQATTADPQLESQLGMILRDYMRDYPSRNSAIAFCAGVEDLRRKLKFMD